MPMFVFRYSRYGATGNQQGEAGRVLLPLSVCPRQIHQRTAHHPYLPNVHAYYCILGNRPQHQLPSLPADHGSDTSVHCSSPGT